MMPSVYRGICHLNLEKIFESDDVELRAQILAGVGSVKGSLLTSEQTSVPSEECMTLSEGTIRFVYNVFLS